MYKTSSDTFKQGADLRFKNYGLHINLQEFKRLREADILKKNTEKMNIRVVENFAHNKKQNIDKPKADLTLQWSTHTYTSSSNPNVWGPCAWLYFHISAANYPINASNITKELMKNRLLALPIEIPCAACRPHAQDFIELNKHRLDEICSGRDSLFKFFVDFHNKVNERHNKPQMSYEDAYNIYVKGENIQVMKMV